MAAEAAPQHMQAFALANRVRFGRADVKRDLRDGRITFTEALASPWVATMSVFHLVAAQHRWGPTRTEGLFRRLAVPVGMTRRVEDLTDRQRDALVAAVERGPGDEV